MFLNVNLKTARHCLSMDFEKKKSKHCMLYRWREIQQYDLKLWSGDKQNSGHFFCTNKQQKNMFSWVMCVCKLVTLERVWARRNQIPWVHNLSVDEDAVVQQACGRIDWQCKSKTWELEGDGMTLTRQWTLHFVEEDRQTLILHC